MQLQPGGSELESTGQEPGPKGPTSQNALRDMLDVAVFQGILVKLFASGLAWAFDRKKRGGSQ